MKQSRARAAVALFSLWLAAAVASGAARSEAASLFKCATADGGVSYQSSACEPGAKQVWERHLDAVGRPAAAASGANAQAGVAVVPRASGPTGPAAVPVQRRVPPRKSDAAACRRAHAADAAYRAQPLSRVKHDGLRRHGDRIRAACG